MVPSPRRTPIGVNTQQQPNGTTPQQQPNGTTPPHQPNGMNSRHQPHMTNPEHQQIGVISNTIQTPNGINSLHEHEDLQHQESQSAPQDRVPIDLPPVDDYPITAIRVPVSTAEPPHYVPLDIRHCPNPACRCWWPDLQEYLGDHELGELDYQVFRALWEPPGMESLHGTYMIFAIKCSTVDNTPYWQRNEHFTARLKGDVFIMKVKEFIITGRAFADPLGHPSRTLPHQSGVHDAHYEHINRRFFGSDLFMEMTLVAASPHSRVTNTAMYQFATPIGFWRAFVQGRLRTTDYQVPPVTPSASLIMEQFWPRHRGVFPSHFEVPS